MENYEIKSEAELKYCKKGVLKERENGFDVLSLEEAIDLLKGTRTPTVNVKSKKPIKPELTNLVMNRIEELGESGRAVITRIKMIGITHDFGIRLALYLLATNDKMDFTEASVKIHEIEICKCLEDTLSMVEGIKDTKLKDKIKAKSTLKGLSYKPLSQQSYSEYVDHMALYELLKFLPFLSDENADKMLKVIQPYYLQEYKLDLDDWETAYSYMILYKEKQKRLCVDLNREELHFSSNQKLAEQLLLLDLNMTVEEARIALISKGFPELANLIVKLPYDMPLNKLVFDARYQEEEIGVRPKRKPKPPRYEIFLPSEDVIESVKTVLMTSNVEKLRTALPVPIDEHIRIYREYGQSRVLLLNIVEEETFTVNSFNVGAFGVKRTFDAIRENTNGTIIQVND